MSSDPLRGIRNRVRDYLPTSVRQLARPIYDTIRVRRADRTFRRRATPKVTTTGGPHVLLVTVDALRADVASDDSVMPFVSSLSGRDAVAPAPWTIPSLTSMFSGQYPHEHGSMRQSDESDHGDPSGLTVPPKVPDSEFLLTDYLASAGYRIYGAFAFETPFLSLADRFGTHRLYNNVRAETLVDDYLTWLGKNSDEPTFAYLHLGDLHAPVSPPTAYWEKHEVDETIEDIRFWKYKTPTDDEDAERYKRHRWNLYRAGADYADTQVERAYETANARLDGDLELFVVGDHGEAFWEHTEFDAEHFHDSRDAYGIDHGGTPYEAIARVPLRSTTVETSGPASLIDVFPTILEQLDIEVPDGTTGESLHSSLPEDRIRLIEATRHGYERKAVYQDDWKLLVSLGDDQSVGFSLPEEEPTNLPPDTETQLRESLPAWPTEGEGRAVDSVVADRLEHLGYK